jgi:hypothetical protein
MGRLIQTIDGGRDTGWAISHAGILVQCGLVKVRDDKPVVIPWINGGLVVLEFPHDQRKVDPNDLIKLASRIGRFWEIALWYGNRVQTVLPGVWKGGSIPKDIHHPRIKAVQTQAEMQVVDLAMSQIAEGKRHNVWDAIGINNWASIKEGLRK